MHLGLAAYVGRFFQGGLDHTSGNSSNFGKCPASQLELTGLVPPLPLAMLRLLTRSSPSHPNECLIRPPVFGLFLERQAGCRGC